MPKKSVARKVRVSKQKRQIIKPGVLKARRSVLKSALRRRSRGPKRIPQKEYTDIEDMLMDMSVENCSEQVNGSDIENLLYSTTSSTADLGYRFGFYIGKSIGLKSEGRRSFPEVLGMFGMHNPLYYPFKDQVIITSKPRGNFPHLGRDIHVYGAGLIAGYLTHVAGMPVNTKERQCVYNGSDLCKFVSEPRTKKEEFPGIGVDAATGAIAGTLLNRGFENKGCECQRILAFIPLVGNKIERHVLKMLVMSGKKMGAAPSQPHISAVISSIANYFGAAEHSVEKKGRKMLIRLRYKSYNSTQGFVSIPAALIAGFAESTGRTARISFTTNRDKSYTVAIEADKRRE